MPAENDHGLCLPSVLKTIEIDISFFIFQLTPPLIPPRGEVNAADAFDIGSFDEDDVKGVKVGG